MEPDIALLSTLKALRSQKLSGDVGPYENIIKSEVGCCLQELNIQQIESFIHNGNEKIQLETMSLIVDSKKSTSKFMKTELKLILNFVKYNLGKKIEFIPIMRKTFKRMKGSLDIFYRSIQMQIKATALLNTIENNKLLNENKEKNDLSDMHSNYMKFVNNVFEFCLSGISPGSTHIRKRNSLQIIELLQDILSKEFEEWLQNKNHSEIIFHCLLLDTYETNKEVAYKILKKMEPSTYKLDDLNTIKKIVDVGLKLGNSIRPIDCITASYILKISLLSPNIEETLENWSIDETKIIDSTLRLIIITLNQLNESVESAEKNIIAATAKHSFYGYVFCIHNLLITVNVEKINRNSLDYKVWQKTIAGLINTCLKLTTAVSIIVNNSSPEGHFPMDFKTMNLNVDDQGNEQESMIVTPQMVLLCSWRTVKEVSLLFGYLTHKFIIEDENSTYSFLSYNQILQIGEHLVTMLCETKHRGAFEQTHVGFEHLCTRLWQCKQGELNNLPKIWLGQILQSVTGVSKDHSKLCTTRRSAGVPFMIQALITSNPAVKSKSDYVIFHSVMKILLGLSQIENEWELLPKAKYLISNSLLCTNDEEEPSITGNNLPTLSVVRTHALNVLRALFLHAQVGKLVKEYAADGFIVAIKNYDGKTWPERNAATLLYSALITRIFGVQRSKDYLNLSVHNKMTGRMFFEKYPSLLNFMLDELKYFTNASDNPIRPSVQLILLILSRLYVSVNCESVEFNWKNEEFIELVSSCAKSRIYTTRQLAARAIVPLLTEKTACLFINELFRKISILVNSQEASRWNLIHGYMLQALEIAKSGLLTLKLGEVHLDILLKSISLVWANIYISPCFPLVGAYVEFVDELFKLDTTQSTNYSDEIYHHALDQLIKYVKQAELMRNYPGKEIFQLSTIKFITHFGFAILNGYIESVEIFQKVWTSILYNSRGEMRILAWKYAANLLSIVDKSIQNEIIIFATESLAQQLMSGEINDPDAYDVFCDFLHRVKPQCDLFQKYDKDILWDAIVSNCDNNHPRATASSLKLVQSLNYLRDMPTKESNLGKRSAAISKIFEIFDNNTWTSSASYDCRLAVVDTLDHVKTVNQSSEPNKFQFYSDALDWWTMLLRSLVDDSSDVRLKAWQLIRDRDTCGQDCCLLEIFFDKFYSNYAEYPQLIFSGCFIWSFLLAKDDFEMDENDVFNKCYNYEIYEPLSIARYCCLYVRKILSDGWDPQCIFEDDLQQLLSEKLDLNKNECKNAQFLINSYKNCLPKLNRNLYDLLDPTYTDKLLKVIACEHLQSEIDHFQRGEKPQTTSITNLADYQLCI